MESYKNIKGDSPIQYYETGAGYIKVWFRGNPTPYRYLTHIETLTRLANQGRGLATFISQNRDELTYDRG